MKAGRSNRPSQLQTKAPQRCTLRGFSVLPPPVGPDAASTAPFAIGVARHGSVTEVGGSGMRESEANAQRAFPVVNDAMGSHVPRANIRQVNATRGAVAPDAAPMPLSCHGLSATHGPSAALLTSCRFMELGETTTFSRWFALCLLLPDHGGRLPGNRAEGLRGLSGLLAPGVFLWWLFRNGVLPPPRGWGDPRARPHREPIHRLDTLVGTATSP